MHTHSVHSLTIVPLLAISSAFPLDGQARASDEIAESDAARAEWFEGLKTPSGQSCCDLGDCRRVHAEWRGDTRGWWALVNGKWRPVPVDKVLSTPPSIDGAAYLCSATAPPAEGSTAQQVTTMLPPIYCFVPPDTGS